MHASVLLAFIPLLAGVSAPLKRALISLRETVFCTAVAQFAVWSSRHLCMHDQASLAPSCALGGQSPCRCANLIERTDDVVASTRETVAF